MMLRARTGGDVVASEARELGAWALRPNPAPSPGEVEISDTGDIQVCRGGADRGFGTKSFAFTADETRDVRILFANWDDIGYTGVSVYAFRCGQSDPSTNLRPDLVR